jgi:hypothetical protein
MSSLITPFRWLGRIASLGLVLSLLVSTSVAAALPINLQDCVRSFYGPLLTTMKDARTLGQSGRCARPAPLVHGVMRRPDHE